MAPTTEQGEEGRRSRLQRRRIPAGFPAPPAATNPSRAIQSAPPPSQRRKRKRSRASRRRKRGKATVRDHEQKDAEEEEAAAASPPAGHASSGASREHENAAEEDEDQEAAAASSPARHASSGASSAVSSPLRWPSIPRTVIGENDFGEKILEPFHKIDPAIVRAHHKLEKKWGVFVG
ncbi:unnamed protein product [Urochloa humidicola]